MNSITSVITIFIFIQLILLINCDTAYDARPINSDYPNKCWSRITNQAYSPGEEFTYNCRLHSCDTSLGFSIIGCGKVAVDKPGCYVRDIDNSKPYPQCCPAIVCDN